MSNNQGSQPGVDYQVQSRKGAGTNAGALVGGRATQPMGARDVQNARVAGFEDIEDQPDWGDNGFAGYKSDVKVVRFDRLDPEPAEEQLAPQGSGDAGA